MKKKKDTTRTDFHECSRGRQRFIRFTNADRKVHLPGEFCVTISCVRLKRLSVFRCKTIYTFLEEKK